MGTVVRKVVKTVVKVVMLPVKIIKKVAKVVWKTVKRAAKVVWKAVAPIVKTVVKYAVKVVMLPVQLIIKHVVCGGLNLGKKMKLDKAAQWIGKKVFKDSTMLCNKAEQLFKAVHYAKNWADF